MEIDDQDVTNEKVTIAEIQGMPEFDRIIVEAKVIMTLDPVKVSPTHTKQDIIVADATGGIKLTV